MRRYFAKSGRELSVDQWRGLFAEPNYKRIAWTDQIDGDYMRSTWHVSTTWNGIANRHGEPLVFETRTFGGPLDGRTEQYDTQRKAELGHDRWVDLVRQASGSGPHKSASWAGPDPDDRPAA